MAVRLWQVVKVLKVAVSYLILTLARLAYGVKSYVLVKELGEVRARPADVAVAARVGVEGAAGAANWRDVGGLRARPRAGSGTG